MHLINCSSIQIILKAISATSRPIYNSRIGISCQTRLRVTKRLHQRDNGWNLKRICSSISTCVFFLLFHLSNCLHLQNFSRLKLNDHFFSPFKSSIIWSWIIYFKNFLRDVIFLFPSFKVQLTMRALLWSVSVLLYAPACQDLGPNVNVSWLSS